MKTMFALVDANNFYVSCERVFQPHLEKKPVIVLSSNDGCAISRSNEAKALGIKMGEPFFKIQNLIKEHHVHVFSANFSLYSQMSSRIMDCLRAFSPAIEAYSIDEAFLDLNDVSRHELFSMSCNIKKLIKQWTGLPVSVGIAPTKTLAKVANHLAKKHPAGVAALLDPGKIEEALRSFPLQEVWGIGFPWAKKLSFFSIKTASDLANADVSWVRKAFNVTLAKTNQELRGISCLKLEEIPPAKKTITSSLSFGGPVTSFEVVKEAISFHASHLARKLRYSGNKTSLISVSVCTNPFDKKGRFYTNTYLVPLPFPSQDTPVIIKAAVSALEKIFREHLSYKKAGVTLLSLCPENQASASLFEAVEAKNSSKRKYLLATIDKLNQRYGRDSLIFGSQGLYNSWQPKSSWKSSSFTQDWDQLLTVT